MNSKERREKRYQRRIKKRLEKKKEKLSEIGSYDNIFSYEKLYDSFYECRKGVRWKKSIQSYEATLPLSTLALFRTMNQRKFKTMGFLEFDITERGKKRHIRAVTIKERCVQRTLCDNYLIPLLSNKLIYDNGASLKGKGVDFALNRLKCHLQRHYRKYGNKGYIFQYDFSSYFDNINHDILLKMLEKAIPDKEIFNVLEKMIRCFGEKGLGLGSQVSQICAIFYPTAIDRYFKEVLHIKGYGRYMDDGYAICKDLEEVKACREGLLEVCKELDIKVNEKKMRISKLSKTFIFLKKRIFLTNTGKVVMKIGKESVVRARRKLKKLAKQVGSSNFTIADFYQCYQSWIGMAKRYKNYYVAENYRKLFEELLLQCEERIKKLC